MVNDKMIIPNKTNENIFKKIINMPIIKVLLYLLPIIISIGIFIVSDKDKAPVYSEKVTSVIAQNDEVNEIKITFKGKEVNNIKSTEIAFWNNGGLYIDKNDVSKTQPLRIVANHEVEILSVDIVSKSRENLNFKTSIQNNSKDGIIITIEGDDALEKKDGALFQILYSDDSEKTKWSFIGRIKGVHGNFKEINWENMKKNAIYSAITCLIYFVFIFIIICSLFRDIQQARKNKISFKLIIPLVMLIFIIISTIGYLISFYYTTFYPPWLSN